MLDWRTAADILLIAAVLFFLYRTFLRLGTWKIVAGIFVATGIYLLASLLDLKGIEWIFGNLSHVAIIALIVIFQPELRKIFERTVSVRRSESGGADSDLARVVANAVFTLANQHRGAIVVFPGKEPIHEWLSGGHKLDARPSIPLILSIFDPHSPGHDGALIVERGKFARYGVRLPVSQTARLSEDYGTRHHAAMGLAEKSDALTVVVSEERGRVSVFRDGKKYPVDDPLKLRDRILAHWKEIGSFAVELPEGKARLAVASQAVASLGLAMVFWSTLVITQSEMLEKVMTVPVEYTASHSQLVLVGDKPSEARLHLAGAKSDLDAITPAQLRVKIDLSKAVAGQQTFFITGETVRLPRGVNILDASPSSISLTLAEIVEHEIPIKAQLVGRLPEGLKLDLVSIQPDRVRVLSPAKDGKEAQSVITTTPIYLEGISENATIFCKIIAPPSVNPVDKRWPDVEVTIRVTGNQKIPRK